MWLVTNEDFIGSFRKVLFPTKGVILLQRMLVKGRSNYLRVWSQRCDFRNSAKLFYDKDDKSCFAWIIGKLSIMVEAVFEFPFWRPSYSPTASSTWMKEESRIWIGTKRSGKKLIQFEKIEIHSLSRNRQCAQSNASFRFELNAYVYVVYIHVPAMLPFLCQRFVFTHSCQSCDSGSSIGKCICIIRLIQFGWQHHAKHPRHAMRKANILLLLGHHGRLSWWIAAGSVILNILCSNPVEGNSSKPVSPTAAMSLDKNGFAKISIYKTSSIGGQQTIFHTSSAKNPWPVPSSQ